MAIGSIYSDAKICTKCREKKERACFAPRAKSPDGLVSWCRACKAEDQKRRYAKGGEASRVERREHRLKNLERRRLQEKVADKRRRAKPGFHEEFRAQASARLRAAYYSSNPVKKCKICGVEYCNLFGRQSSKRTCSDECSRILGAKRRRRKCATRRARKKHAPLGVAFDPVEVFERDGWVCHLCGKTTLRDKIGTAHPRAPTLDHILPLARGGSHSRSNTACAHRACNNRKGTAPGGQFSLLSLLNIEHIIPIAPGSRYPQYPCRHCGTTYERANARQVYCTPACRISNNKRRPRPKLIAAADVDPNHEWNK